MPEITIVKGEEFKTAVKKEITRTDLFLEQYKRAARMLDEIAGASADLFWSWKSQDFENNIIAFCGERGEGKSSAMMTFVNAVYEDSKKENEIFAHCRYLKDVFFAEPVLIDPSLFDDVHNVLDIVLAKIFKNFYTSYNQDNQFVDERTRERLLDRFQKVYRYVSLINNQKQMLDDEFDYEGNISKLTKLGESTNLKQELAGLIEDYLEYQNRQEGNRQLIIAVDDLDLCSANAYKMAEQIRKYLVIPHVCIVISVKIEQLELCIREKNLKDFQEMYKNRDGEIYDKLNREIQIMTERYVSKLIPRQRRIYLPKVQKFEDVRILYKEAGSGEVILDSDQFAHGHKAFAAAMLDLVYERTGMRLLPEADGSSYLLPDNLRDMISWISMIAEMEEAQGSDEVYAENIAKFENYFEREWMEEDLKFYNGMTLQEIGNMDTFHLHTAVKKILEKLYSEADPAYKAKAERITADRPDSFFQVMKWYELFDRNIADKDREACVCRLRTIYTVKINKMLRNKQYAQLTDFFNGYIWGPGFSGILPRHQNSRIDRSRFELGAPKVCACIASKILEGLEGLERFKDDEQYYASYLPEDAFRKRYIQVWIVMGMLFNVCEHDHYTSVFSFEGSLIFDNNKVREYVQISLENYLIALCDLDRLYEKINMQRLGVEREEFKEIIDDLKAKNQDSIRYARLIVSNMDLLLGLKKYCLKKRDYKDTTSDTIDRSRNLVFHFFGNIAAYMKQYGIEIEADQLGTLVLDEDHVIDIALLYAELFNLRTEDVQLQEQLELQSKRNELVEDFREKITQIPKNWSQDEKHVSLRLQNLSAENVKLNLDNLALMVQRYLGENKVQPDSLEVEGLCALYGSVAEMYLKDKQTKITPEMYNEYKWLVKVQNKMKTEAE